jgi:hypothetical protein
MLPNQQKSPDFQEVGNESECARECARGKSNHRADRVASRAFGEELIAAVGSTKSA